MNCPVCTGPAEDIITNDFDGRSFRLIDFVDVVRQCDEQQQLPQTMSIRLSCSQTDARRCQRKRLLPASELIG
jgi:hypothetical protein